VPRKIGGTFLPLLLTLSAYGLRTKRKVKGSMVIDGSSPIASDINLN